MNKLTRHQKDIVAFAIHEHMTQMSNEATKYEKKYPTKKLLIGSNWYLQERDEIFRKLNMSTKSMRTNNK